MNNNKLLEIQEMLFNEMKRLTHEKIEYINEEIARSNALTNGALTFIKTVNTQLRLKETAQKNNQTSKSLLKEVGLDD